MKKVIMVIATTVVAFATQAASFKWSAAQIYAGYSGQGASSALIASATASLYCGETLVDTSTVVNGAIAAKTIEWDGATVGDTYDFIVKIIADDGGNLYEYQATKTGVLALDTGKTATIAFGSQKTASQASGGWAAVPEPTSGLLMLLGIAGLALKRKRA